MANSLTLTPIQRTPPSANYMAGSSNPWRYRKEKKSWQEEIGWELRRSSLPRFLMFVRATATLRFRDARRRDADNHSFLICKALGDALVQLDYLPDDTPDFYRWTNITFGEPGAKLTIIELEYEERLNAA